MIVSIQYTYVISVLDSALIVLLRHICLQRIHGQRNNELQVFFGGFGTQVVQLPFPLTIYQNEDDEWVRVAL